MITVHINSDVSSLGQTATEADVEAYRAKLEEVLLCEFAELAEVEDGIRVVAEPCLWGWNDAPLDEDNTALRMFEEIHWGTILESAVN